MKVHRARSADCTKASAFLREQAITRPETGMSADFWQDTPGTAKRLEDEYYLVAVESGKVVGVGLFVPGSVSIAGKDCLCACGCNLATSGTPAKQIEIGDRIVTYAYENWWKPEGIELVMVEGKAENPSFAYCKLTGFSYEVDGLRFWSIVPVVLGMDIIGKRLAVA